MSWQKEVDELEERRRLAAKMGGKDKVARQHSFGKMDVRQRIDSFLDDGSFREVGGIAGKATYSDDGEIEDFTPANMVFGRGEIGGKPLIVEADDFTVRGGAADAAIWRKVVLAEQMAGELRLPLVRMIDGTGGGGSVKSLEDMGLTYVPFCPGWEFVVANLSTVPVVGLALGATAGLGAARVVTTHFSVMIKGQSQIFAAGPPVVKALGEDHSKEELGGVAIHARNGTVDHVVESEEEAFEATKRFLSYLPPSVYSLAERTEPTDDRDRRDAWLIEAVPKSRQEAYSMRRIIESLVDKGSFFEMGKMYGQGVITGFARLGGWPVAVLANDPSYLGGSVTANGAKKTERFVDLANIFHLPVVNLVDNPGFMIGLEAEKAATIRAGSAAMSAVYEAKVPWASVIIRKAYGVAASAMSDHTRFQYRVAWPSGDWGSLPLEGGIEAAYKTELAEADDPEAHLKDIYTRLDRVRSPFRTAEAFMVEDIIDPRETRPWLCDFAELAQSQLEPGKGRNSFRP